MPTYKIELREKLNQEAAASYQKEKRAEILKFKKAIIKCSYRAAFNGWPKIAAHLYAVEAELEKMMIRNEKQS